MGIAPPNILSLMCDLSNFFFRQVSYCLFWSNFQMVIERANLREEEEGSGSVEEQQMYYIQLAQLVVVVALILAV